MVVLRRYGSTDYCSEHALIFVVPGLCYCVDTSTFHVRTSHSNDRHNSCHARFGTFHAQVTNFRASFGTFPSKSTFSEALSSARRTAVLGMARRVSGMLWYPFHGSWSGDRWLSAGLILVFCNMPCSSLMLSLIALPLR